MHTQRILGVAIGASLLALANAASAQTWPSNDEAGKPPRGSYSGAPAGEGPGAQGSQGLVLQGDGQALRNESTAPGVIVVVPPPAPSTTVIVPAPDNTTPPNVVTPGSTQ